ncbi:MAG: BrnA antitoxin family protein [Candidatus Cloacimonetes bacterium]|nr:BrnA antitoxin family protein [Candidatus Cloacimonadota bacterium]
MRKSIHYTEAPKNITEALIAGKRVIGFLPTPEKLVRIEKKTNLSDKNEDRAKITISLNTDSIDFFKEHAEKQNVKYQTMIKEVLENYVQNYRKNL